MWSMRSYQTLLILLVATCGGNPVPDDIGKFWQITDVHFDANYTAQGSSQFMCHYWPPEGSSTEQLAQHGEFGNYNCDSPWTLFVSSVNAMKLLEPNVDFLLWTGDNAPHVPDDMLSPTKVFNVISNVTDKIAEVFAGVPLYPVLGNHDVWPSNQIPGWENDTYFRDVLSVSGWERHLSKSAQDTFKIGGYYTETLPSGLRIIGLNSVLWLQLDKAVENATDPAGQFAWLEGQLEDAKQDGVKVYLTGHVPPGVLGSAPDVSWLYPHFNQRLTKLIQDYSDTITAGFFAHEHRDNFRIVYDSDGVAAVPLLMAPSVTPWRSTIPGMGANNPSIRLYTYERRSGRLLDYTQYYVNLTAANTQGQADWQTEYSAAKDFRLHDVTAASLARLVDDFKDPYSDDFQNFLKFFGVSYDVAPVCAGLCKKRFLCSLVAVDYRDFVTCMSRRPDDEEEEKPAPVAPNFSGAGRVAHPKLSAEKLHIPAVMMNHYVNGTLGRRPHHHKRHDVPSYMYYVIGALAFLVTVLFVIIALLCCRRRHVVTYFSQPRYMPINT